MPNKYKFKTNGFTLVELLVVVSIIIILSTVGMTIYSQAETRSRDNQRLADLKQVQAALEQYHNDLGWYPKTTDLDFNSGGQISASLPPNPVTQQAVINVYLNILPRDPLYTSGHKNYLYRAKPGKVFGDSSDCDNTSNQCANYCLYVQFDTSLPSSNSCLNGAPELSGYNYAVSKGGS